MKAAVWSLVLCALLAAATAEAGQFRVIPVRVFIKPSEKSTSVRILNEDTNTLTLQVSIMDWSQDGSGQDRFTPTNDILFFPRIVKIPANQEQLIRLSYRGKATGAREGSYRIFLEELPERKPGATVLQMVIKMSIPAFIVPEGTPKEPAWEPGTPTLEQGAIQMQVKNEGMQHLRVESIAVTGLDGAAKELYEERVVGWYVLPGAARTFAVPVPQDRCLNVRRVNIVAKVDRKERTVSAPIQPNLFTCTPPARKSPEPPKQGPTGG